MHVSVFFTPADGIYVGPKTTEQSKDCDGVNEEYGWECDTVYEEDSNGDSNEDADGESDNGFDSRPDSDWNEESVHVFHAPTDHLRASGSGMRT